MIELLTAERLNVEQMERITPKATVEQGREDFERGRVLLRSLEQQSAHLEVGDGKTGRAHSVSVWLQYRQVALICNCRQGYGGVACRHRVAAFLALRDYLEKNPPKIWKALLDRAAQSQPRQTQTYRGPIVFSLQEQRGVWAIRPYMLAAKLFDPADLEDQEAIARAINDLELSGEARPLRARANRQNFPNAPAEAIAAANLAVSSPHVSYGGGFGSQPGASFEAMVPFLTRCLVYSGDEVDPLAERIRVLDQPGEFEVLLTQTKKGLQLQPRLLIDGQPRSLKRNETAIVARDPLWLLAGDTLVHARETDPLVAMLLDESNLLIPPADQDEFLETYMLPLANRVRLAGDAIRQEVVDEAPQPRLYLREKEKELLAELRFGYGAHELPYEKRLPAETTKRIPGELALARIIRRPDHEEAAHKSLSSYGLKRTTEPAVFTLRAGSHTVDFLLRQIPRLAEAGFVIYGEEAIKSARVNRNRPQIRFNVSSGIDWFDVSADVTFGDLVVSLKDIRHAVKRRERYVKLTDGSIGELPPEWIDRYRTMLALGEETGDDTLRYGRSQVTLLDQLLEAGDRADAEFRARAAELRNFEGIKERPLPPGFQGELRPYQKFGYDWLHFLNDYGFGGCLADDMGVGKCQAADTLIAVNGTLRTAEAIWESYAGIVSFDGEGYWAEPSAPLLVNAIDEQSGKITQARVRRLYRQQVRERLRTVRLEDGSSITITRRHKLLTSTGWTNELHEGDYVCVPARLHWNGTPLDPDLVTLLAWQIAEGWEQIGGRVSITQQDVDVLEQLRLLAYKVGSTHNIKINNPYIQPHSSRTAFMLSIASKEYRDFLVSKGYAWGKLSREKSIPDFIMQADLDSVRLFLRNFFEAEASIPRSMRGIEISSASEMLMQQLSVLLRRFGIWLRTSEKQKCATNGSRTMRTYYNGILGGNAARRFCQEIGFAGERKQRLLEAVCAHTSNTNVEGIPASVLVADAVRQSKLPVRHFGMHNTVYIDGSQQFSRESLQRVVGALDRIISGESERAYRAQKSSKWTAQTLAAYSALDMPALQRTRAQLQQLLEQEVFYCRIESIEDIEYDGWVYDFEVERHHNFVANQILCHNTIQTLAFLESLYHEQPDRPASLIVMPRSLLFNWQREAEKFTPELKLFVQADQGRISEPEQFAEHDLVLTTYGTMLRDIDLLRRYRFSYAILDESQAIKNPLAETSKAARLLQSDRRLVLTGTPVENSTTELWSQFAFLNPGLLGNLETFRNEFVSPIERGGDGETAQFLRRMVYPFILRRTKDQVASDLPPRSERVIIADMDPAQRKVYDKQRDYYRALLLGLIENEGMNDARMKILEGLLRLRQICNHPRLADARYKGGSGKFELLIETLETLRAEGHRALVFSQFVQMLSLVREQLDARGIPYAYLDGQTRNRQQVVDQFQGSDELPFFLISLKAGGVGLNLTAADYVIHIDPWWNPAVEMQATDRTHRIGQDKPVFVYKLVVRDSVEEKILQLQEHKRELVEQVIGAEGGVFKSLTREDVEVLFT
jgi:SNF2 family DNA or RNA helicase/intein/homing endonuclease